MVKSGVGSKVSSKLMVNLESTRYNRTTNGYYWWVVPKSGMIPNFKLLGLLGGNVFYFPIPYSVVLQNIVTELLDRVFLINIEVFN